MEEVVCVWEEGSEREGKREKACEGERERMRERVYVSESCFLKEREERELMKEGADKK